MHTEPPSRHPVLTMVLLTSPTPRLICGGSAYPRGWDYAKFREIADSVGAYLMCDMAHIR